MPIKKIEDIIFEREFDAKTGHTSVKKSNNPMNNKYWTPVNIDYNKLKESCR